MSLQLTLDFLTQLEGNNHKAWFDANRKRYQQARSAFETLVAELIAALAEMEDFGALTPKECLFRINRDVRFSHDKSPYNAHMSAEIGRGGRKNEGRGYFLMIAPHDGSFVASGMFEPDKTALDNIRQHLLHDPCPLRDIIAAPDFERVFGGIQGESLKTAPSGYDRNHPNIDLLRYKQMLAVHRLSDADVVSDGLVERIVEARTAMQPFLNYLDWATVTPVESQPLGSSGVR